MKYKNYGDSTKEFSTGSDLELLNITDKVSARNTNRPIVNLYENQEETYKLLNTLLKTVYGNQENAILPDLYEEFCPDGFLIDSFNSSNNYYLRIPTGAVLLRKSIIEDILEKDSLSDSYFSKNNWESFAYVNKPNINLLERQLASIIDMNLSDFYNDIKIDYVELPMGQMIYKAPEGYAPAFGTPEHLKKNKKTLYICEESKAKYYILRTEVKEDTRDFTISGGTHNFIKYYCSNSISEEDILETAPTEPAVYLTDILDDADYSKDLNDHAKKTLGYRITVKENKINGYEETNLPNKLILAHKDIFIKNPASGYYSIKLNGLNITAYSSSNEPKEINENIVTSINLNGGDDISAELLENGFKIILNNPYITNYNNYKITVLYSNDDSEYITCSDIDNVLINEVPVEEVVREEFYYSIFELVNGFIDEFKSRINGNTLNLANYVTGETLLKISGTGETTHYVYYDLCRNPENNSFKEDYDNSGRLRISSSILKEENLILLFAIKSSWPSDTVKNPKVTSIEYNSVVLDKRKISTKIGEFNILSSSNKSDLNGTNNLNGITTIKNGEKELVVNDEGVEVKGGLIVDSISTSGGGKGSLSIDTLEASTSVKTNLIEPLTDEDYTVAKKLEIVDGIKGNGNIINVIVRQDEDPNTKLPGGNEGNEWKLIKREIGFKEI